MSYCRFGHGSDAYCYESVHGGWMVHVGTQRHVSDQPFPTMPDRWWEAHPAKVAEAYKAQTAWYKTAHLEPIGINPPAEDAMFDTPSDAADYLEHMKAMGYEIQQGAIDSLREDALNPDPE